MPIYEYACMECESHFEELVRNAEQAVACPECGAGNVLTRIVSGVTDRTMVTQHGTVGMQMRRAQEQTLELPAYALAVVHSDGIETRWDPACIRPLLDRDPTLIAALLLRDQRHDAHREVVRLRQVDRREAQPLSRSVSSKAALRDSGSSLAITSTGELARCSALASSGRSGQRPPSTMVNAQDRGEGPNRADRDRSGQMVIGGEGLPLTGPG